LGKNIEKPQNNILVVRNTEASLEKFAAKCHLNCGCDLSEKHVDRYSGVKLCVYVDEL